MQNSEILNKKKTILHVTNSNAKSQYLLSIARLYNKEKYNVIIGCFDGYGELNTELEKMGIETFNIPIKNNFQYFFKIIRLYRLIKQKKIDILHLHTFFVSFIGILSGRMARVQQIVVTRHHADQHIRLKKKIHIAIDSWTAKKSDKVIAVSKFTKDILIKTENVPERKVKVIYNGIEPLLYSTQFEKNSFLSENKIPVDANLFLCISRLYYEKNIELIINALATSDTFSNFHLLVAGSGRGNKYHDQLISLIQSKKLEGRVHFLGFRNDIANLISISDALIHPSFSESFGFAALEAMAQEKSLIISNIPSFHEIATDEIAYFFAPTDINSLSKAITLWINSRDNEIRVKKGKKRFEMLFTFKTMISEYEKYYEE